MILIGIVIGIFIVYCVFELTWTIWKIDKIYSVLDPDKVNVELNVIK